MDVSPDHEPTLIERGMNIHLNHPLTARRGIRDSRPARWESRKPHPSTLRKGGEGACKRVRELAPIALSGPRLGGSTHGYTSWRALNADGYRYVRMAPPRPAETLPIPAKTNTSHADKRCEKTLQEHSRSCKASRATPVGALAHPHRTT
jgi:hypothetical protein